MTCPVQRSQRAYWLLAGLIATAACDDKSAEATDSVEHSDHDDGGASEHAHSTGTSRTTENKSTGASEKDEAGKGGSKASAGAAGKSGDESDAAVTAREDDSEAAGASGRRAAVRDAGAAADAAADSGSADAGEPDAGEPDAAATSGDAAATSGEAQALTVRFKAKIGDRDFSCGSEYEMQGSKGTTVTPQDLRLFIQDLALIKEDGTVVPVVNEVRAPWQSPTVALLDFEDASGNCGGTAETNTEITVTVPAGSYKGLRFSNGVPEALNHADVTKEADPLKSSASLSWSWLSGFRFAKIELVGTDTENYGAGVFHPGAQGCTGNPSAGTVTCARSNRAVVEIETFDPETDTVVIDVGALFVGTDMSTESTCHSGEKAVCEPMFNAWGLNFEDGKPKSGQTVFKKE